MSNSCVFCEIVAEESPADVVYNAPHVLGITPLNPVTAGHKIFIPKQHVTDALDDPGVTAITMREASWYGKERAGSDQMNLITSVGPVATQSVYHLHVHLVPRRHGDLLPLPWTPSKPVETTYRAIDKNGRIWCQSRSPGEVVKMSVGHPEQLTFERYAYVSTEGHWLPWDIT